MEVAAAAAAAIVEEATEEAVRFVVALCVNGSSWQVLTDHLFLLNPPQVDTTEVR